MPLVCHLQCKVLTDNIRCDTCFCWQTIEQFFDWIITFVTFRLREKSPFISTAVAIFSRHILWLLKLKKKNMNDWMTGQTRMAAQVGDNRKSYRPPILYTIVVCNQILVVNLNVTPADPGRGSAYKLLFVPVWRCWVKTQVTEMSVNFFFFFYLTSMPGKQTHGIQNAFSINATRSLSSYICCFNCSHS